MQTQKLQKVTIAMIKKLKENFLILLISNMLTIIMIVVAPRIYGAIANLMMTVSDSDSGFSLPMIFYYIPQFGITNSI